MKKMIVLLSMIFVVAVVGSLVSAQQSTTGPIPSLEVQVPDYIYLNYNYTNSNSAAIHCNFSDDCPTDYKCYDIGGYTPLCSPLNPCEFAVCDEHSECISVDGDPVSSKCTNLCRDSDGGKYYYLNGSTISGGDAIAIDYCINDTFLVEQYCDKKVASSIEYDCSSEGRICKDGACVTENNSGCRITYALETETCYANLAIKKNNYSICENLASTNVAGWIPGCYAIIAVEKKDKTICNLINITVWPRYNTQCYDMVDEGDYYGWMIPDQICNNLYWFDNDNKECGQKQFCGTYMYLGLQTFNSKTQCLKALNETNKIEDSCEIDSDCKYFGYAGGCFTPEYIAEAQEKARREGMYIGEADQPWRENVSCICKDNKCEEGMTLSNGRKAEIKIMPETASATAIARLGELNFTIELKEKCLSHVGALQIVVCNPIYELTGNKQGKFLGIFKIMARVTAQVDAETGDVKVIKPWWSFLASGI